MRFEAGFRIALSAFVGAMLLFAALPGAGVRAQGLGDFSAPPPQSAPQKKASPARKPKPGRTAAPAAMRHEELVWFSRQMLCEGTSQVCEESATWPLQTEFDDEYYLMLKVPEAYCSPLYLSVEVDGVMLGTTGLLGPGRSEVLKLGRLSPGNHRLRVTARGSRGGCNRGALDRWGVDLSLSNAPSRQAPAKPPGPVEGSGSTLRPGKSASYPETDLSPDGRKAGLTEPSRRRVSIHVVDVIGSVLTGRHAASLIGALSEAKAEGATAVVVNLESVNRIEEPGIRALSQGQAMYGADNFVLVNLADAPWRHLQEQVPNFFRTYASEEAGVSVLR